MTEPLIALLTDFGTSDPYVGVMKGVMVARCPDVRFIDITHEVSPQSIQEAAYLLRSAYRYFPTHTTFLVVVDPGVGTTRRPLAIKTDHGSYVGPDNGVFSGVLDEIDTWQAVILWPPERLSATFHGRDLFAPVAADLACGQALNNVGTPTTDIVRVSPTRMTQVAADLIEGEVIHVDHFGNIVTSIGPFEALGSKLRLLRKPEVCFEAAYADVTCGEWHLFGIQETYERTRPGDMLALINSDSQLELAVNQGSAARLVGAQPGDIVRLRYRIGENC